MAISYPLTMPLSPAPMDAELYIERNQAKIYSFSKLIHVQRNPGDRWAGKITMPVMTADQAAEWLGFFDALDGYVGTFRMTHPDYKSIQGNAGHEVGSINGGSQKGTSIATAGWPVNTSGLFRRGDMIEVAGKLKRITADVNSDATGEATLDLAPAFYEAPVNGVVIRTVNPAGIFRLSEGFVAPSSDLMRRHTISFAIEEVLS